MEHGFTGDFQAFAMERVERDGVSLELGALSESTSVIEATIISQLGDTEEAVLLMEDYNDLMSETIILRTNAAYKRGMQDAYAFMEMLKGNGQ